MRQTPPAHMRPIGFALLCGWLVLAACVAQVAPAYWLAVAAGFAAGSWPGAPHLGPFAAGVAAWLVVLSVCVPGAHGLLPLQNAAHGWPFAWLLLWATSAPRLRLRLLLLAVALVPPAIALQNSCWPQQQQRYAAAALALAAGIGTYLQASDYLRAKAPRRWQRHAWLAGIAVALGIGPVQPWWPVSVRGGAVPAWAGTAADTGMSSVVRRASAGVLWAQQAQVGAAAAAHVPEVLLRRLCPRSAWRLPCQAPPAWQALAAAGAARCGLVAPAVGALARTTPGSVASLARAPFWQLAAAATHKPRWAQPRPIFDHDKQSWALYLPAQGSARACAQQQLATPVPHISWVVRGNADTHAYGLYADGQAAASACAPPAVGAACGEAGWRCTLQLPGTHPKTQAPLLRWHVCGPAVLLPPSEAAP